MEEGTKGQKMGDQRREEINVHPPSQNQKYISSVGMCAKAQQLKTNLFRVQGSAKRWFLGCVNPAFWLPLAEGGEFMQPRAHLLDEPCMWRFCTTEELG